MLQKTRGLKYKTKKRRRK
jgi:hypothetical protein